MVYSKVLSALLVINFLLFPATATNIVEDHKNVKQRISPLNKDESIAEEPTSFFSSLLNAMSQLFSLTHSNKDDQEPIDVSWYAFPQGKKAPDWQHLWSKGTAHIVERNYDHLVDILYYLDAKLKDPNTSAEFWHCIYSHKKLISEALYQMQNIEVNQSNIEQFKNTVINFYNVLNEGNLPDLIKKDYQFYKKKLAQLPQLEATEDNNEYEAHQENIPLQGLYEKPSQHTIFQEGILLARCLESIGSLERRQNKLGLLQGYIKQLYRELDGGKLHEISIRTLKRLGIDVQIPRKVDWSRAYKGIGFICLLGAAGTISTAAAQRPQFLEDACSGSFEECNTALALIDCCGYSTEINTILSTGYLNNALTFNLVNQDKAVSIDDAISIVMKPINKTYGYYSEIASFDILPSGDFTREIITITQPYAGLSITPISATQYNQTTYDLYGIGNRTNIVNTLMTGSSKPFFFGQNLNAENWLFTITDAGKNFGLVSYVVRPNSSKPYALWTRLITNTTAANRVIPGNLPTTPITSIKPSSATARDNYTIDDLIGSLYSGYVDGPSGGNSRTIQQFAADNNLIPNGLVECFQKIWLDGLACAQYMGNGYTRFTTFFPEQRSSFTFVSKNTVDGPTVNNVMYQQLNSSSIRVLNASYQWNPTLGVPDNTEIIQSGSITNILGSLSQSVVQKFAEFYLPNSTAAIVLQVSQSESGSPVNYYAILGPEIITATTPPSSGPTTSSPTSSSSPTDRNEPTQSPSNSGGLSDEAKIGIGVGAGVVGLGVIATGVGFKIYKDKQKKFKANNFAHNDDVEMNGGKRTQSVASPITREAFTAVQGQGLKDARIRVVGNMYGREYGLYFKVDSAEAEEISQQTGLKIDFSENQDEFDLILGAGQFGQVRVAREEGTHARLFRAIKIVAGEQNVKASLREGTLQARLNGKDNVLPLLEYLHYRPTVESKREITQLLKMTFGSTVVQGQDMTTQDLLLQITPLAAFGNGWTFQDKLAQVKDIKLKNKLLNYIAYSMLTGLRNMHDDGVSHLDVKPTNFLIHTDGTVYISDFGCAQQKDKLKGGIGDFSYFSPERLAHIRFLEQQQGRAYQVKETAPLFSGKAADAWAAGITLLEIANNAYPFDCRVGVVDMLNSWDKNYYAKALTEAFAQAKQVTILPILQRLLAIEPQDRWSTTQAQGEIAKSLSQESPSTLFHSFDDDLFESENLTPRGAVNNNNLYAKKEGIYSSKSDKVSTSQYYGTQLSSYHLMQQAYDEETPLLDYANNNNSRPQFVPMYNNK
ncbi:MAG: hypothetical protein BGO77_06600 [Caedibacter sp. 37-49]|nr:MAG: hypothetical protein BGO77_06600 [Caedibacter sp. 37-49]